MLVLCEYLPVNGVPADLFVLLGLPSGNSADRLRHAYEGAVDAATRRGDFRRVNELSDAFGFLSADLRRAVYAGHGAQAQRWAVDVAPPRRTRRQARRRPALFTSADARRARRAAVDETLTARWHMRRPYRILVRLIVLLIVACQAAVFLQQQQATAAWPVFGVAVGCALLGWLGFRVVNRFKRGDSTRVLEVVAWSSLIGLVGFVAALVCANVAFG